MSEATKTVISKDAEKILAALKDPAAESSEKGRKEYVRITWTDRKDPPMRNCFFAFGDWQFHEGMKRFGLEEGFKDGSVKICHAGAGLYGTREGLDEYFQTLKDRTAADRAEIREKCTPQDVYEVEYNNYECMYDWDGDLQALGRVQFWFGTDAVYKIRRKMYAGMSIEAALERLAKE